MLSLLLSFDQSVNSHPLDELVAQIKLDAETAKQQIITFQLKQAFTSTSAIMIY